jgi:ectoine hydroxylase-related dioxygenase (phytanoyl-CoA dioxygenase family)
LPESNGQGSSESNILKDYPLEKALIVEAESGDVVFFHYLTLHGSMPNRSQKIRKTVLAQLHAGDDMIEESNKHPNARLALSGWNSLAKRSLAAI